MFPALQVQRCLQEDLSKKNIEKLLNWGMNGVWKKEPGCKAKRLENDSWVTSAPARCPTGQPVLTKTLRGANRDGRGGAGCLPGMLRRCQLKGLTYQNVLQNIPEEAEFRVSQLPKHIVYAQIVR